MTPIDARGAMTAPPLRPGSAGAAAAQAIHLALSAPFAFESADGFAHRAGFGSRHQLNRALHAAGLPGFRWVRAVARLLALHRRAAKEHISVCAASLSAGLDPAWVYRTARRLTGRPWSVVRTLGEDEVLQLALHCAQSGAAQHTSSAGR